MRVVDNRFQIDGPVNLEAQSKSDHLRRPLEYFDVSCDVPAFDYDSTT